MARSKFWNFNLTEEEHEQILIFQGRACALCGKTRTKEDKPLKLAVDHDHVSGLIRGLLCFNCNTKLGNLTVEFVKKILAYLLNPPATQVLGSPRIGLVGRVGTKKQRKLYKKLQKLQKAASHEKGILSSSSGAHLIPEPHTSKCQTT